jgi:adenylate cyclase class 1
MVARHVLKQRKSGQPYPIYITEIELSRHMLTKSHMGNFQSIHYLNYKKRIEYTHK